MADVTMAVTVAGLSLESAIEAGDGLESWLADLDALFVARVGATETLELLPFLAGALDTDRAISVRAMEQEFDLINTCSMHGLPSGLAVLNLAEGPMGTLLADLIERVTAAWADSDLSGLFGEASPAVTVTFTRP